MTIASRYALGAALFVALSGCSLLFGSEANPASDAGAVDAAAADATSLAASCSPGTLADDCDDGALCHCGLCSFSDPSCAPSGLRYARDKSPGGECVASASLVDAYYQHTCLLRTDGTVWCWGCNTDGQLGDHSREPSGQGFCEFFSSVPVQVLRSENGPPLDGVVQIQTGIYSTCALRNDGTVWCWGGNGSGQLGSGMDPATLPRSFSPVQVVTSGGEALEAIEHIGSGGASVCATDAARDMWCWGANSKGQLQSGLSDFGDKAVATKVTGDGPWRYVDGGGEHMCASRNGNIGGNNLWCWGRDVFGALGNGQADNPVMGTAVCNGSSTEAHPCSPTAVQVIMDDGSHLSSPSQIGLGNKFSCAATVGPEGLWCWGENDEHALGDQSNIDIPASGSTRYSATPVALNLGLSTVRDVVAGESFACAQLENNLHCWGSDTNGQLGNGSDTSNPLPPNSAPLLSNIRGVTAGFDHACSILADRSVQCWGNNAAGQLGVGNDEQRDVPTPLISDFVCP